VRTFSTVCTRVSTKAASGLLSLQSVCENCRVRPRSSPSSLLFFCPLYSASLFVAPFSSLSLSLWLFLSSTFASFFFSPPSFPPVASPFLSVVSLLLFLSVVRSLGTCVLGRTRSVWTGMARGEGDARGTAIPPFTSNRFGAPNVLSPPFSVSLLCRIPPYFPSLCSSCPLLPLSRPPVVPFPPRLCLPRSSHALSWSERSFRWDSSVHFCVSSFACCPLCFRLLASRAERSLLSPLFLPSNWLVYFCNLSCFSFEKQN